ncbi:hypothetical protein ACDZ94_23645, partial (plasmid) [Pseudomonas sp. UBT]|uniref:hypothetical protein n=1 Tax=Pseudomonas sp. UBT TaxID=3239198 RepID=UPI003D806982
LYSVNVGAGLSDRRTAAMASTRCTWWTEVSASQASQLPQKSSSASDLPLLCFCPAFASTTQVGFQAAVLCF